MRFQSRKHHIIDILFPISLYFVFTVSALTVLLLATNVYRTTTENSALNFNANTSLSYITEKIHQNDTEGAVSIGSFDGHQALILKQHYNDTEYVTYIYVSEGNLMELYTKSSADVDAVQVFFCRNEFMVQMAPPWVMGGWRFLASGIPLFRLFLSSRNVR